MEIWDFTVLPHFNKSDRKRYEKVWSPPGIPDLIILRLTDGLPDCNGINAYQDGVDCKLDCKHSCR